MAWTSPRTWTITEFVTKAILDTHVRDNFRMMWHDLTWDTSSSTASLTGHTAAAAVTCITSSSVTSAGLSTEIEVFCPDVTVTGGDTVSVHIWEDTADLGCVWVSQAATGTVHTGCRGSIKRTPSAGAHTYTARAWTTVNTGTWNPGAGGVGVNVPAWIRVREIGG